MGPAPLHGEETVPHGVVLPLDIVPGAPDPGMPSPRVSTGRLGVRTYSPERQRDIVRLVVTCGLLLILGYLVVFATFESTSYPQHWAQTKEMLQILLPALTGIIGTVIGFYFGTTAAGQSQPPGDDTGN